MVHNRSGSLAQRQEVPSSLGQLSMKCKTWQVLLLILFAPHSPLPKIRNPSPLKKNKRFQNTPSTPPFSPQYWQFYLYTQTSPPFSSLATKPKLNEYFIRVWLMEHSGSCPLGTLHNGVLTASQCNILSLSKRDVCLPVEPTHYYCLVSLVPVFTSRARSPATAICHHCAPSSYPRRLAQLQALFFHSTFWGLYLMWGGECLQSFSFKDIHRDKQSQHRLTQG